MELNAKARLEAAPSGGPAKALRTYAKKPTTPAKKKAEALALADQIEAAESEKEAAKVAAAKSLNKYSKLVNRVTEFTAWQN